MLEIRYGGLRIEPTLAATRELLKHNKDLTDVLEILHEGYICGTKRKPEIIEKCIRKGDKEFKAVVAKTLVTYPDNYKEYVWRLIHFGKVTFKKR